MRLLNIRTFDLEEFFDTKIPPYAILSHRWYETEVTFKQMAKRTAPEGPSLRKIRQFCELVGQNSLEWAWIDTCCIDKRSSAELSEAINSMFKWYGGADICCVYLSDVLRLGDNDFDAKFASSSWFTRGWTLQELLAPRDLIFYDARWAELGNKRKLRKKIAAITGIDSVSLMRPERCSWPSYDGGASIATKMSWAARRVTSRSEDIAYCLFGLFGVNMPLLYGEGGEKAFLRLQIEIINTSDDESIFAWSADMESSGLLATEPRFFESSRDFMRYQPAVVDDRPRFWMTNKGLAVDLPPYALDYPEAETHSGACGLNISMRLNCEHKDRPNKFLSINICARYDGSWCRSNCRSLEVSELFPSKVAERSRVFWVRQPSLSECKARGDFQLWHNFRWNKEPQLQRKNETANQDYHSMIRDLLH